MTIFFILVSVFIVIAIIKKGVPTLTAHWNTLLDEFSFSTKEFYNLLETELQSHGISKVNIVQKNISIGNALSGRRLYLRVKWKQYTYDCCCAPFGKGTFISWYLFTEKTGFELLVSKIPFVGNYLVQTFFPVTYYSIDTSSMFLTYAQSSVLKVINDITNEKGVRSLSESERKPIMKNIFKR